MKNLISIKIFGEKSEVPKNNTLLRCFQYHLMEIISYGDFCWNGDFANCHVWLENTEKDKPVLSCRTKVQDGMQIVLMSGESEIVVN